MYKVNKKHTRTKSYPERQLPLKSNTENTRKTSVDVVLVFSILPWKIGRIVLLFLLTLNRFAGIVARIKLN